MNIDNILIILLLVQLLLILVLVFRKGGGPGISTERMDSLDNRLTSEFAVSRSESADCLQGTRVQITGVCTTLSER